MFSRLSNEGKHAMIMNSKDVGEKTEAIILAEFIKIGFAVLLPFGDNQKYDLVVDCGNRGFIRIQCKTGRIKDGAIRFFACTCPPKRGNNKRVGYVGKADYFGVYCPGNNKVYLVPVSETASIEDMSLRVDEPKNGQNKRVRWAIDYEFENVVGKWEEEHSSADK